MSSDRDVERAPHDGIHYCPLCGVQASPLFAHMNDDKATAVMDCPDHGRMEVSYEFQ